MTTASMLATSLGRRDEAPNVELAERIAAAEDRDAVQELMDVLRGAKRDLQHDAIKVLYEIGARQPAPIAGHAQSFGDLLGHRSNRLIWGAMTALAAIAPHDPDAVASLLTPIMTAAESGSVIARDNAVRVLIALCAVRRHADSAFPLLLAQLRRCPDNQLPMYAEEAADVVAGSGLAAAFAEALALRLDELPTEAKRKRVAKIMNRWKRS